MSFNAILNPNCPVDIMEFLAKEMHKYSSRELSNYGISRNFSENPNTPSHIFELLPRSCLQESVAHHNYPKDRYQEIIARGHDGDVGNVEVIRSNLAKNTSLSADQSEILLSDPSVKVRSQLAKNSSVPCHVLKLLGLEFSMPITQALLRNEKLRSRRVNKTELLDANDLQQRLVSQIEGRVYQVGSEVSMDELRSFLNLLPHEEEFRVNKGEYKKRIRKIKKSDFYKFL